MTNDPRHEARKLALGSIFGWLFSDIDNDSSLEYSQLILDCKDADINLAKELTDGVEKNIKEIDDKGRINLSIKAVDPEFASRKGLTPTTAPNAPFPRKETGPH